MPHLNLALYDRDTVKRLAQGKNAVEFRVKNVNRVRDYAWNKTQIENQLMVGIMTGKSPKQIAGSFLQVMGRNQAAAIRNARTSVTSAQNAGRMDTYRRAKDMGTELQIEWIATWDKRTRISHAQQDGERIELDGTFSNGCRYPADPKGAPEEVYNCRCTTRAVLDGINDGDRETYEDWKAEKEYIQSLGAPEDEEQLIADDVKKSDIPYNKPQKMDRGLTASQAREKVGMLDPTIGSCSSVALAYIGNRAGYDVLDFRDGNSLHYFAKHQNIARIAKIDGVKSVVRYSRAGFSTAMYMLENNVKENKEYLFSIGSHSCIIKKANGKLAFLELQGEKEANGWYALDEEVLRTRFFVKDFNTDKNGNAYRYAAVLIDSRTLYDKKEFIELLGYLNSKQ